MIIINNKESEKEGNYLDLAKELKKLWEMKVTVIPVVFGVLGTVCKGLEKDWRNRTSEVGSKPYRSQHC